MKIVLRNRRCGKTTELAAWAHANNGIIITINVQEAERICKAYDLPRSRVVSFHEVYTNKVMLGRGDVPVAIDNLDLVVQNFLGFTIDTASLTGEK